MVESVSEPRHFVSRTHASNHYAMMALETVWTAKLISKEFSDKRALNAVRRNPRGQGQIQPLRYGEVVPVSGAGSCGLRMKTKLGWRNCFRSLL